MPETPSKLQRLAARNIVTNYLKVRAGENTIIESWEHTLPMATAMLDEVRRVGGKALFVYNDEESWWRTLDRRQSKLLGDSSAPEWAALKAADVYVNFWGPADTDRIETLADRPGDEAFAWLGDWYAAAREAGLRGVRMTTGFVTEGRARRWSRDLARWEEDMLRASLIDPDDLARSGTRLCAALSRGKKVRITHSNGTDLEIALAGGAPRLLDGRPHAYRQGDSPSGMLQPVPAGVVNVALDSKTASGVLHANRRTNIWWNWSAGGTFEFANGKLSSYSFEDGSGEFARQYSKGTAGKDRASALMIGLNPAARNVPNLETVERGCATVTIGRNRHLNGGTNGSSFMSWISLAECELAVDGAPVVRGGKIL